MTSFSELLQSLRTARMRPSVVMHHPRTELPADVLAEGLLPVEADIEPAMVHIWEQTAAQGVLSFCGLFSWQAKRCCWCNWTRPIARFYRNRGRAQGVQGKCKDCDRQWRRDRGEKGLGRT